MHLERKVDQLRSQACHFLFQAVKSLLPVTQFAHVGLQVVQRVVCRQPYDGTFLFLVAFWLTFSFRIISAFLAFLPFRVILPLAPQVHSHARLLAQLILYYSDLRISRLCGGLAVVLLVLAGLRISAICNHVLHLLASNFVQPSRQRFFPLL